MLEDIFKEVEIGLDDLVTHKKGFAASFRHSSRHTVDTYMSALDIFTQYFAASPGFRFSVDDVVKYKSYLENDRKIKSLSVRTYMTALRKFFGYLVDGNVLEKNPAKRVSHKSCVQPASLYILGSGQIARLLDSFDKTTPAGLRDLSIISLMLATCCRESEIITANIANISIYRKKWYFHIPCSDSKGIIEKVNLPESAAKPMSEYIAKRGSMAPPEAPLFISYSNRSANTRLTARGLREIIMSAFKSSGILLNGCIPPPAALRHTAASLLWQSGKPPEYIMQRLGIKNKQTALKYCLPE